MLREAALRVTRPRVAVLSAVHEHPHADTYSIIGARARGPRRRLPPGRLRRAAGAHRRRPGAASSSRPAPSARYESRVADNHHHIVCRSCGAIADVDCAVGDDAVPDRVDDHGYEIDEAEVIYWGLCPGCSTARPFLNHHLDPGEIPMSDQPDAVVGEMNEETSDGGCPVAHERAPYPIEGGGNRGWWPNRLNLKILAKNPAVANPMGEELRLRRRVRVSSTSTRSSRTSRRC